MKAKPTFRQAIVTKYLGPTNHRGARISAKCAAGSIMAPWDYELSTEINHASACVQLARKLGWTSDDFHGGALPDGTIAWANVAITEVK